MTFEEFCEAYAEIDEFLTPEITDRIEWFEVINRYGESDFIPTFDGPLHCRDYPGCRIDIVTGYGMRLSANGYLDCTDWEVSLNRDEIIDDMARIHLEG